MNKTTQHLFTVICVSAIMVALTFVSCKNDEPTAPPPPQIIDVGRANLTRYVAIGNSITAGYQSNALSGRDQAYSYPKLIANRVGVSFEQPLMKNSGVGNRKRLMSLTGPVIVDEANVYPADPAPYVNAPPTTAYDNLGIPGAVLGDIINTTDFAGQENQPRKNPFFKLILRNSTIGKNILNQAKSRNPTFMTCWIGNNDVLGYATTGGLSGTNIFPPAGTLPTESAVFAGLYSQLLDSLKAIVDTNLVVANIPDVTSIPFFTTVGPSMKAGLPPGLWLRYQRGTNRGVSFDSTRFTESVPPLVCLTGITYASLLGRAGGQGGGRYYKDNGITPPAGIDTTKPFGFHPQNPWPTALMLDPGEIAIAQAAITAFNSTISQLTTAKRIGLVDANAILRTYATPPGVYYAGYGSFSSAFITGGLFSYDGVHPSSRGHVIIANEFIKVINTKFKATIPLIGFSAAPGIPIGKISLVEGGAQIGSLDFSLNLMQGGGRR